MTDRPEIVCICGSAKFMTEMRAANRDLTFTGVIVSAPSEADESPTPEQKAVLMALHLRKIDLAERVLIVNPGGYVGELTRRESSTPKRPANQSPSRTVVMTTARSSAESASDDARQPAVRRRFKVAPDPGGVTRLEGTSRRRDSQALVTAATRY